jgi:hypothetical protein
VGDQADAVCLRWTSGSDVFRIEFTWPYRGDSPPAAPWRGGMSMTHFCDTTYCSKCHKDRVENARAAGYTAGALKALRQAVEFYLSPFPVPFMHLMEATIAHVEANGVLPEATP